MPPRSVKMKRRILGFQRRVWWPKWTPASSSSRIETTGTDSAPFGWLGLLPAGAGWNRRSRGAGTATGLIRRVGCENRGMVADGDFGTKACRLPRADGGPAVGAVPSPEVDVRELVVRVGTIGCFGGGAAVGTFVPVPYAGTPLATEWILRALEAL